jgi:hypothetical protein
LSLSDVAVVAVQVLVMRRAARLVVVVVEVPVS